MNKDNQVRNYASIIFEIITFGLNVFRVYFVNLDSYECFPLFLSIGDFYEGYRKFTLYNKMNSIKSNLPDATKEDIEKHDICIICRETMKIGNAKKLPCGHCFHPICLERWINKNASCPTCSVSLEEIIEKSENDHNNDGEIENQN